MKPRPSRPGRPRGFTLIELSMGLLLSSILIGVIAEAWNHFHRISSEMAERCRLAQEADFCLLHIAEDLRVWAQRPWTERQTLGRPGCVDQILVIPEPANQSTQYFREIEPDEPRIEKARLIRVRFDGATEIERQVIGSCVQGLELTWDDTDAGSLATLSLRLATSYRLPSQGDGVTLETTSRLLVVLP